MARVLAGREQHRMESGACRRRENPLRGLDGFRGGRRPFKDVVIPKRASSKETMQGFKGARGILVLIGTRFRGGQDSSCAIECDVRLGRGGAFGMTMLYGVIPSDKPADASTP